MKKVRVLWSEVTYYLGDIEIPEGLTKEEETDYVENNLPFDIAKEVQSDIEWSSVEYAEWE